MTTKTDTVGKLLSRIKPRWPIPKAPKKDIGLLDQGVILVLMRHMAQSQAEASLTSLLGAYEDWNEARVAQVQELASHLRTSVRKKGVDLLRANTPAARTLKDYLQEIYQKTHGLDLDFMRDDLGAAAKLVAQTEVLGLEGGSYLLWVAGGEQLPVHTGLVRTFDRLGLIARTASMKKARVLLEALVPAGKTLEFTAAFSEVVGRWCEARKPLCHECSLVDDCNFGKKAYKDWQAQQVRLAAQRKREEERRKIQEAKEAERKKREEERARKRSAGEAARRKRALERVRREAARKAAAVKQAAAKKAAAKQAAIAAKKAAAKKAAAKKAAEKKAAAKKAAAKKAAAKKTAAKKKAVGKKKGSTKKPASRKAPARKKAAKKAPARKKASARKPTTKKAAKKTAKKATTKKSTARSATAKKTTTRKSSARPAAKTTARKKTKKAAKKTSRRR